MRIASLGLVIVIACNGDKPAPRPAAVGSAAVEVITPTAPPPASTAVSPARIDAFWSWFRDHAAELRAVKDLEKTMGTVSLEIAKVNPDVFGEIGAQGDDRLLVLSADGRSELFGIVQAMFAARPTVPGWKIVAFRQRDPGMQIAMGKTQLDAQVIKFTAKPGDGGKLDVQVFVPGAATVDEMRQVGFVVMDHTVGEFDMGTKVGNVDFAPIKDAPATAKPLAEMPALVDALPATH